MKYHEILAENKKLKDNLEGSPLGIRVLSNIITNQLKEILEYELAREGILADVDFGNYDNMVQDAAGMEDEKVVILFWEAANLTEGLEYKADLMEGAAFDQLLEKVKSEIRLTLDQLKDVPLVIFNLFSSMSFTARLIEGNRFDQLVSDLNDFLKGLDYRNVRFMDINKPLTITGLDSAVDRRNYYSSKALYTVDFFRNYASMAKHMILPVTGKVNKALIFDCDNTLWYGILGEDGFDGILMSAHSAKGKPFEAIQHMAKKLAGEGVLIGLCSKNNPEDVEEILGNHKDMILREEDLAIKKVNWNNKASNLKEMAEALNIGLDSFVFVDDSDFELGLVNEELPEVKTLKVNPKNYLYPHDFAGIVNRFYRLSRTEEDRKKVEMYKQQAARDSAKTGFGDIQTYLDSLGIEMEILKNETSIIPRMAQMTQKTNQFNLTTKRYTEADMEKFVHGSEADTYAISVKDKYGDSGVTGLAIVRKRSDEAEIDTFLMSCRIIGRKIEHAFMDQVMADIGQVPVKSSFLPSKKNVQVREFFEQFGFDILREDNGEKHYLLSPENYTQFGNSHIVIKHGAKT